MKKFLTAIIFFVMVSTAEAGTVETLGQGIDQRSAIRAALRQAIELELGLFVDSRTRIKNHQLIENEIITNSAGLIESYEIISENQHDGMYEVKVRSNVRSEKLRAELMTRLQKQSLVELNMNDPRIKVVAVDQNGNELIDVENEFIKALRTQGFNRLILNAADADYIADIKINEAVIAARLVNAVSGEIICAETFAKQRRMFTDTTPWAINNAARLLANAALEHAAQLEQHVTLIIVTPTIEINPLIERLKNISGVNDVFRRNAVEFDINFDGTASDLATALEREGIVIRALSSSMIKI